MRVRFGDFSLDTETRQLHRGTAEVHLSTRAFDLLRLLLEARPRVVPKAELQEALWPGIFVSEASLFTLVSEVRTATEDGARESRFVRTVHGVGYAFSAEVIELTPARAQLQRGSEFMVVSGTRQITLGGGENVLGRDTNISVCLDSTQVSRRHARITITGNRAMLEDLGSRNGTYVNEARVDLAVSLKDGDQIRVGSVLCTFRAVHSNSSTETVDLTT